MVVPPRTAAPVGECSIVRQNLSEVLINVSALSEARFHKSVKSERDALRAFDRTV